MRQISDDDWDRLRELKQKLIKLDSELASIPCEDVVRIRQSNLLDIRLLLNLIIK